MNDRAPDLELKLLECRRRLARLDSELEAIPHWTGSRPLRDRIGQTLRHMGELQNQPERKLAIVIVGPCGAGKSTLLNALAGQDDLSAAGPERPTTHDLSVFCSHPEDGRYFKEKAGVEHVKTVTSDAARELRRLVIVDTPDTNSIAGERHRASVQAALEAADVLICVFPADRATVRDQIVFLKPWAERFNADALYVAVTMSEKFQGEALETEVMIPLKNLLKENWRHSPARMLAVSARSHLETPAWKSGEEPASGCRDDFPALRAEIAERLNRPEFARDMRAARAGEWVARMEEQAARDVGAYAADAALARNSLRALSLKLWRAGVEKTSGTVTIPLIESHLARRMWGPLSWCLLAWSFLLRVVELLASATGVMRRFSEQGRPTGGNSPETELPGGSLTNEIERIAETGWPEIEDALRRAGFAAPFRSNPLRGEAGELFARRLESRIRSERENYGLRAAGGIFSGWGMELVLNLLFLAPVICLAVSGAKQLWFQQGLSAGFGRESAYFVGLCWILILALMHGWIGFKGRKLLGGERLRDLPDDSCIIQAAPDALSETERLLALRDALDDCRPTGSKCPE